MSSSRRTRSVVVSGESWRGEGEQAVGLAAHRRRHDDELVPGPHPFGDPARDALDPLRRAHRRAAVLVNDQCHGEEARARCGRKEPGTQTPGDSDSSQRPVAARPGAFASAGSQVSPTCGSPAAAQRARVDAEAGHEDRHAVAADDRPVAQRTARRRSPGTGASGCAAVGSRPPGSDRRARADAARGAPPSRPGCRLRATRSTRNAPRQAAISWRPARLRSTTSGSASSVDAAGAVDRVQPAAIAAQLAGRRQASDAAARTRAPRPSGARPGSPAAARRARCAAIAARPGAGARSRARARPARSRPRRVGDRGEVGGGDLVDHGGRVLDALRGVGQRALGIGEGVDERRPDAPAQAIAREAVVVVAVVVDPAQAMAPRIGLDRLARLAEPRARPGDAVATRRPSASPRAPRRRRRAAPGAGRSRPGRADGGQGGRGRRRARAPSRAGRDSGTGAPRLRRSAPAPDASARRLATQLDRQAAPRPARAERARVVEPGVGVRRSGRGGHAARAPTRRAARPARASRGAARSNRARR